MKWARPHPKDGVVRKSEPRDGVEELSRYLARREKRVATGENTPGSKTRREAAVCHKWHVRWCERGTKAPLLDRFYCGGWGCAVFIGEGARCGIGCAPWRCSVCAGGRWSGVPFRLVGCRSCRMWPDGGWRMCGAGCPAARR